MPIIIDPGDPGIGELLFTNIMYEGDINSFKSVIIDLDKDQFWAMID